MGTSKDYYDILGVSPSVEAEALKAVYRALAKKYHPDKTPHTSTSETFREIQEAYDVLSDPELREVYDRERFQEADASIERRAEGASRADRFDKSAQNPEGQGVSPTKFLVICLLIAILGGGGYAWFDSDLDIGVGGSDGTTSTAPAVPAPSVNSVVNAKPDEQSKTTASEPASMSCDELPKVPWWGNASHDSITNYVNNKADGDWGAYIAKWERQLEKLSGVYAKGGTVIAPKLGTRLTGPVLGEYIAQVEARLEITRCLAKAHGGQ